MGALHRYSAGGTCRRIEIAFEALAAALPLLLDGLAAFGALALPLRRRVGGGRGTVVLELGEDLGPAAGLAHGHRVRVRVRPSVRHRP
jgi:hypothetical protein